MRSQLLLLACAFIAFGAYAAETDEYDAASQCDSCEKWNEPQQPFRIYGNTYYVGAAGVSAILIDSGVGLVLLDGGLPQTAAYIVANIEALGFAIEDVQVIGLSHAHFDHAGGLAALQRKSGANVVTSAAAVAALNAGNVLNDDPLFGMPSEYTQFPAVTGTSIIPDGESLTLGDLQVKAIYTPGHTPGGVTWSWSSCEHGRCLSVVYADSISAVSAPDFVLADDRPNDAGTLLRGSIERIAALDCDIFLAPHPFQFQMHEKLNDSGVDPFLDVQGCREYANNALLKLGRRLAAGG